jgi:uncharacterized protein DUF5317
VLGLLLPAVVAAATARAMHGSVRGWAQQRVRWSPLAVGALLVQAAVFSPLLDEQQWVLTFGKWIWVASMFAVLAMLTRNTLGAQGGLRVAWILAATGVAANLLVVTANDGVMPRTVPLRSQREDVAQHLSNVFLVEDDHATLLWLGDVIAQPEWLPLANAVSVGDLLLSMGLASWIFVAASPGGSRRSPRAALVLSESGQAP